MQDPVAEIKSKLSIEDIVVPYVQLKKAGKYLKACCPFHQEKTPSFFVSPERQIAYCFACQKGGDLFQFIQDIEGLDFRGALELLAEKAGVELPKYSGGPKISKDLKDRLKAANQDASKFFVQELWKTDKGKKVLEYLRNRGMKDKTIRVFDVGFVPDGKDTLYRHLLEKKHEKDDILGSSLAIARDSESKQLIDRFRLRLMFPIDNVQGDYIAFGGRALKKGDKPKYLNSPEYVLYNKGATLYNLSRAKKSIRENDLVVFVEGYFDVMASHQAGIENVVATSGTALTEGQFKLVKRYTKKVALAFDSDSAGQEALMRAIHTAQPLGLEIFVIEIPEGKDAADAVKEDPKLWKKAVEDRRPYLEFFETKWREAFDLSTSTGKKAFTDAFLDLLKGAPHPVERDHFLKELSRLVGTPIDLLYDYLNQLKSERKHGKVRRKEEVTAQSEKKDKRERLLSYFTGMILAFSKEFFTTWEKLEDFEIFESRSRKLGLVKPMYKLDADRYKSFYGEFEKFLNSPDYEFNASSVYKQVRDHYNRHAVVDEAFYASIEEAELLEKMAFEAEVKNSDLNLVEKEFEKLITLLYFEFTN